MRRVRRSELLDWVTWDERRDALRPAVLAEKELRRVQVGEHLTFLFENATTVRYQVQEMMRTERIVREADVRHELETYNELLGGEGELGCTLLIEIDDPAERARKLAAWLELPWHVYAVLDGGEKVYARFDERQIGDERLSSVHYLKFAVAGRVPRALGVDLAGALEVEGELSSEQREALREDLAAG